MEPEVYGRYKLLQSIGRGGMAEVFLAKTEGLGGVGRRLAIKRIHPQFTSDENFVKMFIDEARIVGHFHHPNIVQLVDFGQIGSSYYIAMEYVDGVNVANIMGFALKNRARIVPEAIIEIGIQFGQGMDYAHRETDQEGEPLGIVHRDLTPHNILVAREGSVKITDFGIAKASMNTHMTQAGMIKGKVPYMSPEQAMGSPLDNRSDLFSIGIILYEMCTLKRLFQGPSDFHVLQKVIAAEIPSVREQNPDIPEELERIIMKLLTADRDARYSSAGEMADDLRRLKFTMGERFAVFRLSEYISLVIDAHRNPSVNKKSLPPRRNSGSGGRAPQQLGRPDALAGVAAKANKGFNIPQTSAPSSNAPNAEEATRLIDTNALKREAVEQAAIDNTETVLAGPEAARAIRDQLKVGKPPGGTLSKVPQTQSSDNQDAATMVPGLRLPKSVEAPTVKMDLNDAQAMELANLASVQDPNEVQGTQTSSENADVDETAPPSTPQIPAPATKESKIRPVWILLLVGALLGLIFIVVNRSAPDASLTIRGTPMGATVTIDGQPVSKDSTYLMSQAPTGQPIKVLITKEGYRSHKEQVTLQAGQQVLVSYALNKAPPVQVVEEKPKMGTLNLVTDPPGAVIIVAGRPTDWITPVEVPLVANEQHTLTFRLEGYNDLEQSFKVTVDEKRTESLQLSPSAP